MTAVKSMPIDCFRYVNGASGPRMGFEIDPSGKIADGVMRHGRLWRFTGHISVEVSWSPLRFWRRPEIKVIGLYHAKGLS